MGETTCIVQVTNIAPNASQEQMRTFFSFLGEIEELAMYPDDENNPGNQSKVCYVKYQDPTCVSVAQHLTNTVFIDRALIVQPHTSNSIPDAETAQSLTSGIAFNGGSNSGLISQIVPGVGGAQVISTIDPRLSALGLPQYPPLPANTDPSRVEEIRRTIYVGNLDSKLSAEDVMTFFNQIGEVKYVRMAGDENQPTRFSFVEFTEQSSVANALQYNGAMLGGRPLKINHSNNAIVKPQPKPVILPVPQLDRLSHLDPGIEEAMKRVREAQSQITAQIDPLTLRLPEIERDKRRSSSRSRSRSRRRSSSRDRRRSKSRDRGSRRRSRSRERRRSPRRRSRSREKRRSRSVSKERRREREYSYRRSPTPDRRERDRDRDRDRSSRYERRRSPDRRSDRERERDRVRDIDRDVRPSKSSRRRSRTRSPSRERTPEVKKRRDDYHDSPPPKVTRNESPEASPSRSTPSKAGKREVVSREEASSPVKNDRNSSRSPSPVKPEGPATPLDTPTTSPPATGEEKIVEYKKRRSLSREREVRRRSRSRDRETRHKKTTRKSRSRSPGRRDRRSDRIDKLPSSRRDQHHHREEEFQ